MMGEPSGSSRREARTREERQTGKQCRSRKALDLNRPNREDPYIVAVDDGSGLQPVSSAAIAIDTGLN